MKKLENRMTLVTSATKGIGLVCALKLAEADTSVCMGVCRLQATQEICDEYRERGHKMVPVYLGVTDRLNYQSMAEEIVQEAGQINILTSNSGIGRSAEDLDLVSGSESVFFDMLDLNLGSVYRISRLVVLYMLRAGGGSIVNISSIGEMISDITRIGYGVSKSAINDITQQTVAQFARRNIRCNAALPGLTATSAVLKNMPEEFLKSFLPHIPLNWMGVLEDIANAVLFLSRDDSIYIAEHILDVVGGYGIETPQYGDMMRKQCYPSQIFSTTIICREMREWEMFL